MKKLVERGEETICEEPPCPKEGKEEAVALWKFKLKKQQDKIEECENRKEKAFSSVLGKCDETVITRLESMKEHGTAEEVGDVTALMGLIRHSAVGVSDRVCPGMQAANAWKTLGGCIRMKTKVH